MTFDRRCNSTWGGRRNVTGAMHSDSEFDSYLVRLRRCVVAPITAIKDEIRCKYIALGLQPVYKLAIASKLSSYPREEPG
jgi:hypothetical protein